MGWHKYGAKKVKDEDGTFDSKKEHRRWQELKLMEQAGAISHLSRDTKECTFDLHGMDGSVVCRYVADAIYLEDGQNVAEDTKSDITRKNRAYRIKRKLLIAEYKGWEHRET